MIQEIEAVLVAGGLTFDNTSTTQLRDAIQTIGGGSATASVKTTGFTADFGGVYLCKVGGGGFTATLPASPTSADDGKTITLIKSDSGLNGNTLTVGRNGSNTMASATGLLIEPSGGVTTKIVFMWDDTASEWVTAV